MDSLHVRMHMRVPACGAAPVVARAHWPPRVTTLVEGEPACLRVAVTVNLYDSGRCAKPPRAVSAVWAMLA